MVSVGVAALVAIVIGVLLALSGGGTKSTSVNTAGPSATAVPGASVPTTLSEGLDDAGLQAALLTVNDLPTGYAVAPPSEDNTSNDFCQGQDPFADVAPVATADVNFQGGQLGPFLTEGIERYSDTSTAKQVMQAVKSLTTTCGSWTETDPEDQSTQHYSLSALSFPSLADETYAMRLNVTGGPVPIVGDLVFVRRGSYVTIMVNVAASAVDSTQTATFARKADRKLAAAI